jgi:hypothetical protein
MQKLDYIKLGLIDFHNVMCITKYKEKYFMAEQC